MCPADGVCKVALHEGGDEDRDPTIPYHDSSLEATFQEEAVPSVV
jgi:hypothetical protein